MRIVNPKRRTSLFLAFLMVSSVLLWVPTVSAADGDNDGFADSIDDCPFAAGNSTITKLGCPDTDGDGTPDILQGTVADFNEADYARTVGTSSSRGSMARTLAVAPNGMFLAGADGCDCVKLFDAAGNEIKTLLTIDSNPRDLSFTPNGTLLGVSAYEANNNASVHVFTVDWTTQTAALLVDLSANHEEDMYALRFSPDGSLLHVGGQDQNVTTYYSSNWTIAHIIDVGDDVYTIKTSPDGRMVAFTHGEELSVHWTSNGTQFFNRHNHSGYTLGLDWSPDGNWIVTGSSDNDIHIYHASNGTLMRTLSYSSDVNEIAFNHAGTHLVIATSDNDPTWIIRTSDWTVEASFGSFGGGSGSGSSGRRGARDVAWSQDETKIYFGARYYGRIYTYYSTDAYAWLGGDVTGELMGQRFFEYADTHSDYIPMHFNSTTIQTTNWLCNDINPKGDAPLIAAASSTAAERHTTPLANYSDSGMRDCDTTSGQLIEVPVARMPAVMMLDPNTVTHQCMNVTGGLSMGQVRWILSGASESTLTSSNPVHPGVNWNSIVPNDDGDGKPEWRDLHSSCPNEPIHIIQRWENRSVSQMISSFLFCDHCNFPESWFPGDGVERLRLIYETREEIINGAANNEDVIGITELVAGIGSNEVYHIPVFDNWTHGALAASSAGQTAILPSFNNSSTGVWPFQDDYRLVIRADQLEELRPFLSWMLSEEGQANFDEIGFVRLDPFSRVGAGDRIGIDLRHILPDDDGDGVWNGEDLCPNTDPGVPVNPTGCAENQRDDDGDGLNNTEDDCPYTYGTSTQPTVGCLDSDGDSWADSADAFPSEPSQWNDTDGDGFGDESDGFQADACPSEYGLSTEDRFGCQDSDGDGWSDLNDMFPSNPSQWIDADGDGIGDNYTWGNVINDIRVSEYGDAFPNDATQHKDRDGDGYGDNPDGFLPDTCPDQYGSSTMGGRIGCPDADGDGWADVDDAFPDEPTQHSDEDGDGYGDTLTGLMADNCQGTLPEEITLVDNYGCAPSQRDGDYDGVTDDLDHCPNTPETEVLDVDVNGCSASERDTDGDGAIDSVDEYPFDPTQTIDTDGDGFGNNPSGNDGDDCPDEEGTSTGNLRGCVDGDGDGWADVEDIVPNIGTQWNDTDGDGYYDNYANILWKDDEMRVNLSWPGQLVPGARDPDRCPLHANSLQNLENPGCPDDMYPAGDDTGDTTTNPIVARDSGGGLGATAWILIAALIILLIAIGGGTTMLMKKPKKKSGKRSIVHSNDEKPIESEPESEEELSLEDDPNYKVDENGCEWWYDEGVWWYRKPDMDDWAEYDS